MGFIERRTEAGLIYARRPAELLPILGGKVAEKETKKLWEAAYAKAVYDGNKGFAVYDNNPDSQTLLAYEDTTSFTSVSNKEFKVDWTVYTDLNRQQSFMLNIEEVNGDRNISYHSSNANSGIAYRDYYRVLPTVEARSFLHEYLSSEYNPFLTRQYAAEKAKELDQYEHILYGKAGDLDAPSVPATISFDFEVRSSVKQI